MSAKKTLIMALIMVFTLAFRTMGQNNPGEADVQYQKARELTYDRKYSEAIDTLKAAFSNDHQNKRVLLLMGEIYIKIGNLPGAEQAFNQLRALDPKVPLGYVKLAEVYWYWEKYSAAMEYLKTASQLSSPPDASVFHWKGQLYRSMNQPERSDSILKEGLKYYPDNPLLLANYSATMLVQGDTASAMKYMSKAYNIDSSSVYVVNAMATYHLATGNIKAASYYLGRATRIDPDDPFTRSNVMAFSMESKQAESQQNFIEGNKAFDKALYRKARDFYLKAIDEDSLFFEAQINLSYSYIHLGDLEKAVESFEKAARIRPDHALAYIGWGDALFGMGEIDSAIEKYKKATELEPDDSEIEKIYRDAIDMKDSLEITDE